MAIKDFGKGLKSSLNDAIDTVKTKAKEVCHLPADVPAFCRLYVAHLCPIEERGGAGQPRFQYGNAGSASLGTHRR